MVGAAKSRITDATVQALVEARHDDPFAVLGPHEMPRRGGDPRPGARRRPARGARGGLPARSWASWHRATRRACSRACSRIGRSGSATPCAPATRAGTWDLHDPYRFPPGAGRDGRLPDPRRHAPAAVGAAGRACDRACGRRRASHFAVWAPNAAPGLAWSATSTTGTAGATRCGGAAASGSGRSSSRASAEGVRLQVRDRGRPTGRCCRSRPTPSAPAPSCARRPPRSCAGIDDFAVDRRRAGSRRRAARRSRSRRRSASYEVHLGSWARGEGNRFLTYDELAERLIPYAIDMGFTHLELLPINEHPFDGSWGYQPVGLFAPTSRHGTPRGLRPLRRPLPPGRASACCWTGCPAISRPTPHGLGHFDGTALYEHADPRQGFHQDWSTLIYNFGRTRGRQLPASPTRCSGSTATISTACGSMPWPRCSTSTTRARPASGCPTSSAGARTSKRSTSCAA